ncbi:MAG: UDP-N-acetylmuramoyl-tripeptide--D-alanyl-D-alanine ligase [Lachnospiraceae bacterium]|nr:UDP-N-acetylmuramoyl-tripeptide--D-alanyl-D-alanine ligase [Lachnospiraceae bacterium]
MNLTIGQIAEACGGRLVLQRRANCGNEGKADGVAAGCEQSREAYRVSSVVLDSRQVTEDGVFVATVGERVDGHKFIGDVFEKGVCLVVTEKTPDQVETEHGVRADRWGNYLLVEDTFQALKDIAEAYRKTLSIPIVGITGSVGKTSTKEFIAGVLSEKYNVLKTEGNFNNEVGVPLTLLRIRKTHEAAVVEMGISDFGEMHRLSKMVRPNVCVITNIGQCHLENLGTRDGILKAKTEIFDFMADDGAICLNRDDDKLATVNEVKGRKPYFFGVEEGKEKSVYATDIVSKGLWGSDAVLHFNGALEEKGQEQLLVNVPLPGRHMVSNAAAAACVGSVLGLTGEEIAQGVSKVAAISGRNHLMRLPYYTLIDDCYNANPVSMKAAIDLLQLADTEMTAILGDMFELGTDSDAMHAEVGAYAARAGIHRIYCVGENAKHMYEAACEVAAPYQTVLYFATRQQLEQMLQEKRDEMIPHGSTILLKASHGMHFSEMIELRIFE